LVAKQKFREKFIMKKTMIAFVCLALSLPAAALPVRSDFLMSSTLGKSSPLKYLVDQILQKADNHEIPAFYSLKIEAMNATEELKTLCREYSRTAGFLKLEIDFGLEVKSYFFSTRETAEDLKLCQNQH
jgi:hypothetical protein